MNLAKTNNYLVILVRGALFFLLVFAATQTVLFFVWGPEASTSELNITETRSNFTMSEGIDAIVQANLFGVANAPNTPSIADLENTRLNLTLVGIVFNEADPAASLALISQGSQRTREYRVGDRVAGIAQLTEILPSRVILTRAGQLELLTFKHSSEIFQVSEELDSQGAFNSTGGFEGEIFRASTMTLDTDPMNQNQVSGSLAKNIYEDFKDELHSDPLAVLEEWGMQPVSSTDTRGYRLEEQLASKLGLREGDVLLSVDGFSVGKVDNDLRSLIPKLDSSTVRLEIQRGENIFHIEISTD